MWHLSLDAKRMTILPSVWPVLSRNDQRDEGDYANAANPSRGNAPELQSLGQGFNVIEDRGSCGGEARNTLKESIDDGELTTKHQVRYGTEDTSCHPAACDDAKAFLDTHFFLWLCRDDSEKAAKCGRHRREY